MSILWTLVVLHGVLAGVLSAALVVAAIRRRPQFPGVELGLTLVVLTNLGTIVPSLVGDSVEAAPWLLALAMGSWLVVLFTFPDGRPAPGWTVWVLLAAIVGIGLSVVAIGGDSVRPGVFLAAFSVGVGSQVWRYQRRSTVKERQATKWLLAGLVPAAAVFIGVGLVVSTTSLDAAVFDQPWYLAASVIAIWLVPVAGTVGLLAADRGRIDSVVQALIVTAGVVVLVAWVYFTCLPVVGPTWSAAIAVALLLPVRSAFQRIATRIVYARDHASPVLLLEQSLVASVREQDVATVVARTVADALELPYVAVQFEDGVAAEVGEGSATGNGRPDLESFPVLYLGTEVAEIVVAPRIGDVTLAGRDREVLLRLAASAGPALHGAAALRELSVARERLVHTREEERRRLRRDLHDDLAPTLAGLSMRAAAAASLGHTDQDGADQLLADVQAGIHAAIAQVRQIAYDLRPPMLDDLGLEATIRDRLGTEVDPDLRVDVEVRDLPSKLPAAVELAALRIVQEAVTNVRRHARASNCRVTLTCDSRHLDVAIKDDGRGIASGHLRGVGLRSIEERATELGGHSQVESGPGRGTTVTVSLPLRGDKG